jgi:hypothetical protein
MTRPATFLASPCISEINASPYTSIKFINDLGGVADGLLRALELDYYRSLAHYITFGTAN